MTFPRELTDAEPYDKRAALEVSLEQAKLLNESIQKVRAGIEHLSDDDRLMVFADIAAGYCRECGRPDPKGRCQCWNDD